MDGNDRGTRIIKIFWFIWILIPIIFFLEWENRSQGHTLKTISEDKEQILQEMPTLEISEAERAAEEIVWKSPIIKQTIVSNEDYVKLPSKDVEELFGTMIPENAESVYVEVGEAVIMVRYSVMNVSTNLCYYPDDEDRMIKIITVDNSKGDINSRLLYINYENETFEKQENVRIWFDQTRELLGRIFG